MDQPTQTSKTDETGQYLDIKGQPTGQYNQVIRQQFADTEKQKAMAAQGLNADGSPIKPGYNSQLDPATGLLKSPYQLSAPKIDYSNVDSYKQYKDAAMDTGLSPWAKMQQQLVDTQKQQDLSDLAGKSMQAGAQGRSALSMRGGLSNAQRTELALHGSRDLMSGNQDVYKNASNNRAGIAANDAANKQSMLAQVMGLDTGASKENAENVAKASQFNIQNALGEQQNQNTWNMDTYKEQMQKWAAGKQADATQASGGGGGGK